MKVSKKVFIAPLIGVVLIASGALIVSNSSNSSALSSGLNMGTSSTYGVLASSAITSATPSDVSGTAGGDIGVGGATPHTGTITKTGAEILSGASLTAITDAQAAFNDTRTSTDEPVELGGTTLQSGAYSHGTFGITGTLTLDGNNDANSVFIFRTDSTLITAASSQVVLTNGAQACNVFWQVGSSATLGASSTMVGHVIALASISTGETTTVNGQLIALTGAVTLGGTTIVNNSCSAPTPTPTPTVSSTPTPAPPAPQRRAPEATFAPVPPPIPGELHIIKVVVNRHGGTMLAKDFGIVIRRVGQNVPIKVAPGLGGAGWSIALDPGTYQLSEDPTPGYRGAWSGSITPGGTVVITPKGDITVTRTNYDLGTTTTEPTPIESPAGTVTGGKLPKTSTPWGNYLIIGGALILIGGIGYETRKHLVTKKK